MSQNPLNLYFRSVEEFIALPSGTSYYDPTIIEFNEQGEVGIMPMTSKDELLLKNPDALLNGTAVAAMLLNCVPGLKQPKKLLQSDAEILIIAIRKATFGNEMEFTTTCPSCKEENSFVLDLSNVMGTASPIRDDYYVEIRSGVKVYIQPQSYDTYLKTTTLVFENFKKGQTVTADLETKFLADTYEEVAKVQFELLADNVIKIEADGIPDAVTNKTHIHEFIMNISAKEAENITNIIKEVGKLGVSKTLDMECQKCNHEWKNEISFDPTSFFTQS